MAISTTRDVNGVTDNRVEVLIVGAGPAGLMMAEWMAKCGIKTRIVDKRGTKVYIYIYMKIASSATDTGYRSSMARQMVYNVVHWRSLTLLNSATVLGLSQIIC